MPAIGLLRAVDGGIIADLLQFDSRACRSLAAPVAGDWPFPAAAGDTVARDLPWQQFFTDERLRRLIGIALDNNRDLRVAILNIEQARAKAQEIGQSAPNVFDVSQNDCGGMCQCDPCQAIAKAEESEAGPILDFVNYLADAVRSDYPEVCIDTLAYSMTQKPPKTIKPLSP